MQTTQEAHMSLYPSPCKEDLLKYCLLKYIQVMLFFSFQDINLIQYIYIPALLTSCKNKFISNNFYSSYVNKKTFSKKKFPPKKIRFPLKPFVQSLPSKNLPKIFKFAALLFKLSKMFGPGQHTF